jgi:predicted nucleic acid-binding protein
MANQRKCIFFYTIDKYKYILYYENMGIVLDASAIMAVIVDEPESEIVINYTKNSIIISPNIISFEISNALTRMMKKGIIDKKEKIIDLIKNFQKIPIKIIEINLEKSLEIA